MDAREHRLNSLTRQLQRTDISSLPVDDRCSLIHDFSQAIVCEFDGRREKKSEIDPLSDVDEDEFEVEVGLLKNLVQGLSYSDTFMRWFLERQDALIETLNARLPVSNLRRAWENSDPIQRRVQLSNVLRIQCEAFSAREISFFPPVIGQLTGGAATTLGSVDMSADNLINRVAPSVKMRYSLLNNANPHRAVETGYHENIHYMLFILAIRAASGVVPKNHPLYEDAEMEIAKIKHGAIVSSRIDSCYRAQPEEILCYNSEAIFKKGWLEPEQA